MFKFNRRSTTRTALGLAATALLGVGFQNCGGFQARVASLGSPSSATTAGTSLVPGGGDAPVASNVPAAPAPAPAPTPVPVAANSGFSTGFVGPTSRQGASEGRMWMSDADYDQRYARMKSLGAGYREYNMYWNELENAGIPSSTTPVQCPAGQTLVPATEADRVALGFHRFRCFDQSRIAGWDNLLTRDQANGMQSAIIMFSAPAMYRHPNCQGFLFAGNFMKDGCVPRDDAMDDFEDYANFAAARWNGGALGKISHFIVWNENASADYFDYTPYVSKTSVAADQVAKRIDKYADMFKRVHAALMRHQRRALMYVSTDIFMNPNAQTGHMGNAALLEGLWTRLGVNYSWSVAVHPYGDVDKTPKSGRVSFNNLEIVSQFQASHLTAAGIADVASAPQYKLIASEQGWPITTAAGTAGALGRENQARQMCLAHAKIQSMPNVVAVGHNYFHSSEAQENGAGGTSVQGAFYGLIPFDIPNSLAGAEKTPTGRAFMSTMNPSLWNQSNDHFCCQLYKVGCAGGSNAFLGIATVEATHQITGQIDAVDAAADGGAVVRGWACAHGVDASIPVEFYLNGATGDHLTGKADQPSEAAVNAACASVEGAAHRFAFTIPADARRTYAGRALTVRGVSPLGFTNLTLANSGSVTIPAP